MSNNDEEISEDIQRQLDEIEAALTLPQSKQYFKDTVRKKGALEALEQFHSEAARSIMVNPRIQEIRQELKLGINIEGSPTVALIIAIIPGIEGEYQGLSGRFEANVISDLKLGAVPTGK